MIKTLIALSALTLGSVSAARADSINGFFSAFGNDSFTNSEITFAPGSSSVQPGIGGTFGTYLTQGNPIVFIAIPGGLPYTPGQQTAPPGLPAFFTTTEGGETFSFFLTSYNADYIAPGGPSEAGCTSGDTCLLVTGNGYFTGTGAVGYTQTPATFQFDSSYVPGQAVGTMTSFAAQASAFGSPVPEPASLALLGTGLLGVVGIARRRMKA